jgi:endonuclease YncB( thermonuclease family)
MPAAIVCQAPVAIDGDTIRCSNLARHVRLVGIDAPELHGCPRPRICTQGDGQAAKQLMRRLLASGRVTIRPAGDGGFGRMAGRVWAGRIDVNCAMLASGMAVPRYQQISCPSV